MLIPQPMSYLSIYASSTLTTAVCRRCLLHGCITLIPLASTAGVITVNKCRIFEIMCLHHRIIVVPSVDHLFRDSTKLLHSIKLVMMYVRSLKAILKLLIKNSHCLDTISCLSKILLNTHTNDLLFRDIAFYEIRPTPVYCIFRT